MSRGMSRGGSGFPIIIAVLGVLILGVIGIFVYMQLSNNNDAAANNNGVPTMEPTSEVTAIPTVEPTPEPTPEPVVTVPPVTPEPTADPAATATPYITAAPVYNSGTRWVNVDALKIHTQANFESDTVGKIPYGTQVQGDINGKWMNTTYDGTSGYIYLGKTSAGRSCVVGSESQLTPLDPEPDATEKDLVSSIAKVSNDSDYMTVQIDFSSGVYSNDDKTGNLSSSDFTITGGTLSQITSGSAGTSIVVLKIQLLGSATDVTVTVKAQAVFDASGNAAKSESATLPIT